MENIDEKLTAIRQIYEEYGSRRIEQRVGVLCLCFNGDSGAGVDKAEVEQDVSGWKTEMQADENKFITILKTQSVSHFRKAFDQYMARSRFQTQETNDQEISSNLEQVEYSNLTFGYSHK